MKHILTLLAVLALAIPAMAQRPLVTLSHNGELSFFSNLSALETALDSASNGDVIYLSDGQFTAKSDTLRINKRVKIIGNGYQSQILPEILIDMKNNTYSATDPVLFDGVRTNTIRFLPDTISRNNLHESEIRRCKINEIINLGYAGNDARVDGCYIDNLYCGGAENNNTFILHSKIAYLGENSGYAIQVLNCNIAKAYYLPHITISSIIDDDSNTTNSYIKVCGTHYIYYSLINSTKTGINTSDPIIKDHLYYKSTTIGSGFFLDDNLDCTLDLEEKGYLGQDGTVVGVYGGENPFSESPTTPTVDSKNSSVEYDAASNKLKVTITVKPN